MPGQLRRYFVETKMVGGRGRDRTGDPLLAKQVLSQLSYTPTIAGTFILMHLSPFRELNLFFSHWSESPFLRQSRRETRTSIMRLCGEGSAAAR